MANLLCRIFGHQWGDWYELGMLRLKTRDCRRCTVHIHAYDDEGWDF